MGQESKSTEYSDYKQKCNDLLDVPEIRFAGLIDHMGNLVAGGLKKGITPLEKDSDKQKMYMEIKLRALTRNEFDSSLTPVKFSACRREKLVELSFPIGKNVLFITAEPTVDIEKIAQKIIKISKIQVST